MLRGFRRFDKTQVIAPDAALPGRNEAIATASTHAVFGNELKCPLDDGLAEIVFGLGCFWGAERKFWQQPGVVSTAVGYGAGYTPNPTYEEVCSGQTGHNELVRVVFDTSKTDLAALLKVFWESHNPTQGMRQGNDIGTQYRSGIYCADEAQAEQAKASLERYQRALTAVGLGEITTEILPLSGFYYAEAYHQQYLHKNPNGYCGLGGVGVVLI